MLDRKTKDAKYAVKWEGYSIEEMSWEPRENFVDETEKCVRYKCIVDIYDQTF